MKGYLYSIISLVLWFWSLRVHTSLSTIIRLFVVSTFGNAIRIVILHILVEEKVSQENRYDRSLCQNWLRNVPLFATKHTAWKTFYNLCRSCDVVHAAPAASWKRLGCPIDTWTGCATATAHQTITIWYAKFLAQPLRCQQFDNLLWWRTNTHRCYYPNIPRQGGSAL